MLELTCDEIMELIILQCQDCPKKLLRIIYRTAHVIPTNQQSMLTFSVDMSLQDSIQNHEDTSNLQSSLSIEKTTVVTLSDYLLAFGTFFFYSEYFFLIMETLFENSFKSVVTVPQALECMRKLVQEKKKKSKMHTQMPSLDKVKGILEHQQVPESINFAQFCQLLYNAVKHDFGGNMLLLMDEQAVAVPLNCAQVFREHWEQAFLVHKNKQLAILAQQQAAKEKAESQKKEQTTIELEKSSSEEDDDNDSDQDDD